MPSRAPKGRKCRLPDTRAKRKVANAEPLGAEPSWFEERLQEVQVGRHRPASPRIWDHEPNAAEEHLARCLRRAGLGGFQQRAYVSGYEVDFLFPEARLVVELDGLVHLDPHVRQRDRTKEAALRHRGYRVVRVECRLLRVAPDLVVRRIRDELRSGGNFPGRV